MKGINEEFYNVWLKMKLALQIRKYIKHFMLVFLWVASTLYPQEQPKVFWDKVAFPVVTVKDSMLINELAQELFIPLDSTTQHLVVVDLNFDGPGARDILIIYPSNEVYFLDFISEKVTQMMRKWPPYNIRSMVLTDASVLTEVDTTAVPYLPIVKGLHQNIQRIYGTHPIKVFYSQKEEGIQFEILELNSDAQGLKRQTSGKSEKDSSSNDNKHSR